MERMNLEEVLKKSQKVMTDCHNSDNKYNRNKQGAGAHLDSLCISAVTTVSTIGAFLENKYAKGIDISIKDGKLPDCLQFDAIVSENDKLVIMQNIQKVINVIQGTNIRIGENKKLKQDMDSVNMNNGGVRGVDSPIMLDVTKFKSDVLTSSVTLNITDYLLEDDKAVEMINELSGKMITNVIRYSALIDSDLCTTDTCFNFYMDRLKESEKCCSEVLKVKTENSKALIDRHAQFLLSRVLPEFNGYKRDIIAEFTYMTDLIKSSNVKFVESVFGEINKVLREEYEIAVSVLNIDGRLF